MRGKSPSKIRERHAGAVTYQIASDIVPRQMPSWEADPESDSAWIMFAIRDRWPKSSPDYHAAIHRRFTELYQGIPARDAVTAIECGYSSPSAAMRAHVIKRRRYVGEDFS